MTRGAWRWAKAGMLALALSGCSGAKDPGPWIEEDAAVVHCTTSGRTRMPPVLLGLPVPMPPTGLYARRMDPMGLEDMGFTRDHAACAVLMPPTQAELDVASTPLATLSELIDRTSDVAVHEVPCACETADALGVRELVAACATMPARNCADSEDRRDKLQALLMPLVRAIETTPIPRVHWRLVGPTDRPTWFVDRHEQLLARHTGGSLVYLRGQAVPMRDNYALIRQLLDRDDVVAVVRQDAGQALLVVRIVDGLQILDHFELPPIRPELASVRAFVDNARPGDIFDALDKPDAVFKPLLPASDGNFVELDAAALERMDELLVAASPLSVARYSTADEERTEPEVYVARVSIQAPFGAEGLALRVAAELTSAGTLWATAMPDDKLTADVSVLDLSDEAPSFVPGTEPAPPFFLRGTDTDAIVVQGLHRLAKVFAALEVHRPGALGGTAHAWDIRLAQGSLAHGGALVPPKALTSLAEQVLERDYRLTADIDDRAGKIVANIRPD